MQKSAENRENKNSQAYRLKNIVMKSKGMVIVGGIFLLLLFSIMIITNRISSEQLEDTMYLNQYRLGSKALTAAVQAYSVTGDQHYYDAYMKELNEDKNRDIAWAGLEENDIKAEVEASEIREMSVNRHHFKNIEFYSSLTNKYYYTRTSKQGTLSVFEKDTNTEIPNNSSPSKKQIVLQALKDLNADVNDGLTLYQLEHRLEKIVNSSNSVSD